VTKHELRTAIENSDPIAALFYTNILEEREASEIEAAIKTIETVLYSSARTTAEIEAWITIKDKLRS